MIQQINKSNEKITIMEEKSMKEELMKSEFVQKRYNQIERDKGKSEADKWLDMLIRSV